MNVHKHRSYLLEQHSESFNIWSAIIRINTEGKSSIVKVGLNLAGRVKISYCVIISGPLYCTVHN